ncbi:MAG: hypothetical protein KGL39_49865, partial [Patescibacteria group bacterium]|nr:hypothetical protein [Patescibacteria group bacterium]
LPSESFSVIAVGIGQSIDIAIKNATNVAEQIKGRELTFDFSAFDKLKDTINQGRNYGLPF